jgi:RNA polymerase sigma-70 factor (ECF subfamily)
MEMQITAGAVPFIPEARERTITELDDIDTLVRSYRPRLLRFVAFSIGDLDLAETITQDCFLKAYTGRANFRGDCAVSTWLFSIAHNLVRDYQRTQKFRFWRTARATALDISDVASIIKSEESSPESRVLTQERIEAMMHAMEDLSERQRSVFAMRFLEEMELHEIADALHMPVNTVKTHLHRAIKSMRAQLR